MTCVVNPSGDSLTTTTISEERGNASKTVLYLMIAHGCFLCLSGLSSMQLKHILTEQGQGAVSGADVSHHVGALGTFDISCCGSCWSYCTILCVQGFWYTDVMGRLTKQPVVAVLCCTLCCTDFQCFVAILKLFRIACLIIFISS